MYSYQRIVLFVIGLFISQVGLSIGANGPRARVTLQMVLSFELSKNCDDMVYKVMVCAGEFTNDCQLSGLVVRYLQAACTLPPSSKPITFEINSVENTIELNVSLHRINEESSIRRLRRGELRVTEKREVSVTSTDLTVTVQFKAEYTCLPNYFGKLCNKFCNISAEAHVCDEWGDANCRKGFFHDPNSNQCLKDMCLSMPQHCMNNGTCVTNPELGNLRPFCLCMPMYTGPRCEHLQPPTTIITTTSTTVASTTKEVVSTSQTTPSTLIGTLSKTSGSDGRQRLSKDVSNVQRSEDKKVPISIFTSQSPMHTATNGILYPSEQSTDTQEVVKWGPTVRVTKVNPRLGGGETVKKPFLLVAIGGLVVLIIVVIAGFCVMMFVQRRKYFPSKQIKTFHGPSESLQFALPPRHWASVDQSPIRQMSLEDQLFFQDPIPSLSLLNANTQMTSACDISNPLGTNDESVAYGVPMQTSFTNPIGRQSTADGCIFPSDQWSGESHRFATIPRNCITLGQHRMLETDPIDSIYAPMTPLNGISTMMNNGCQSLSQARARTMFEPMLSGPISSQPMTSSSCGFDNNHYIYHSSSNPFSTTPLINGPTNFRQIGRPYNSIYAVPPTLGPLSDMRTPESTNSICATNTDMGTVLDQMERLDPSPVPPPPPPTQFADSCGPTIC